MKTVSEKSTTTSSTSASKTTGSMFFARRGGGDFFPPVYHKYESPVQTKLTINKPGDKFEQEADMTADRVVRMTASSSEKDNLVSRTALPEEKIQKATLPEEKVQKATLPEEKVQKATLPEEKVQKATLPEEKVQKVSGHEVRNNKTGENILHRKAYGNSQSAGSELQSAIHGRLSGGDPLSGDVRSYMEPRFNSDFGNVRVHTDHKAAEVSEDLNAKAFTFRNHVFFAGNQYQPGTDGGKRLLAHELTHTIQQGQTTYKSPVISKTSAQPQIQQNDSGRIRDWLARKAYIIPGFRMFTVVLGVNPINMQSTDRSPAGILRAAIEIIPGGSVISQTLNNYGLLNKVADWVFLQIKTLGLVRDTFEAAFAQFILSLRPSDYIPFNWGKVWSRATGIFTPSINRLNSFIDSIEKEILKIVKTYMLKPLAVLARGTRGYDLLKAILGEDPVTGEPVPRNAETLIGGFMKLIGEQEVWENIKKAKAIPRAWAWFQGVLSGLLVIVRTIPGRIRDTISSLTFLDIVSVYGAFGKIAGVFINIAGDLFKWGVNQVLGLLEIIFSVVAPGVLPYISKAQATFAIILKDPVGFVRNLVRAGNEGFLMFASRIGEHLKAALIKWIVGPLADAGVYIPKSFSLMEIIKLVLSVLGLTWQNIRSKLVKIIPEPVLAGLEKTAGILVTLAKEGPAAAWEQIKAELSELKDQLISRIRQMVITEIVKAATVKLVSMLNPAGAVIQAIIAIYNTITFFVQKINQIAAVVASFIDSISAIASGQVENAAKKVEQTMANTLTIVIAFLAKFIGLGNVPDKIVGIIRKIRQPIDRGLDKIVAWLGNIMKKMAMTAKSAIKKVGGMIFPKKSITISGETHTLQVVELKGVNRIVIQSKRFNLSEFILEAREKESSEPNSSFRSAIQNLEKEGTQWEKMTEDSEQKRADKSKAYERVYYHVQNVFQYMPIDQSLPVSQITWAPDPKGRACKVKVDPLTLNGAGGSQPQEEIAGWKGVSDVPEARIRAHLLHHDLHGPGRRFNITPTSTSTNGLMFHRFEKHAIKSVSRKKQLFYMTEVFYDDSQKGKLKDVAKKIKMTVYDLKTKKPIDGTDKKEDQFTNY
jgi:hypothetical protein